MAWGRDPAVPHHCWSGMGLFTVDISMFFPLSGCCNASSLFCETWGRPASDYEVDFGRAKRKHLDWTPPSSISPTSTTIKDATSFKDAFGLDSKFILLPVLHDGVSPKIEADSSSAVHGYATLRPCLHEPMPIYATTPGLQPPSSRFMPPGRS